MSPKSHALLSASGAHRWMLCPASALIEAQLPDRDAGADAAEGRAAHDLAEQCLRGDVNADTYLHDCVSDVTVDLQMVEAVQMYLDYVRSQPGQRLIEQPVDFSPWVPQGFGTPDMVVLHDGTARIIDLKYGRGTKIEAENNPQLLLYALGVLNEYGFLYDCTSFQLVIHQPRLDHISEWTIRRDDLTAWASAILRPAANLALSGDAPIQPGATQCRFCKAKATCRVLADHTVRTATNRLTSLGQQLDPSSPLSLDLKQITHLSSEDIGALLPHLKTLTDWAKSVETHALEQMEKGVQIPGYKLVASRSLRKWRDEGAAEVALLQHLTHTEIFNQKLLSPLQAEKRLGKDHPVLREQSVKPVGKAALAPVSDKRPALERSINSQP